MADRPLAPVLDDLEAEEDELDRVLADLAVATWDAPTPADGWTVRHQVVHLAQGEELAALAVVSPDGFRDEVARLLADLDSVAAGTDAEAATTSPEKLRARWRAAAAATVGALRRHDGRTRIDWVAGPMAPATFAGARLMETFAHGHDVLAAIGRRPESTGRLVHVADLGVRTRGFSFRSRGLEVPEVPHIALSGPNGEEWSWGDSKAADEVRGPVLDFCEVVTQRRHVDDTGLAVRGPGARRWMEIAQAFAGPPTAGPRPTG